MDGSFAYYIVRQEDKGANVAILFEAFKDFPPVSPHNINMFQAYCNIGKFYLSLHSPKSFGLI